MTNAKLKGFLTALAKPEVQRDYAYRSDCLLEDFNKCKETRNDLLRRVNAVGIQTLEELKQALVNNELAYV